MKLRLAAEWELQSAVLIAWPHAGTDWARQLAAVENGYLVLAAAITRFEPLLVIVANTAVEAHARSLLGDADIKLDRVRFITLPYNDTWLRDCGPITLSDERGGFQFTDFRFTGWGGKYEGTQDDDLVAGLLRSGLFSQVTHHRINWALEGGAIECDGEGTLLTTWRCLKQRHPKQSRTQISAMLQEYLYANRVLWLEHGYLEGDDTDAHIDTLARFASNQSIVFQSCDDSGDPHYEELQRMGSELKSLRTRNGRAYNLYPLPWARPVIDEGRRLAASYANYLVINGAVLVPAYGDAADDKAASVIAAAHPRREVVKVPCRPFIWQNGSLHCLTMQLPKGLHLGDIG